MAEKATVDGLPGCLVAVFTGVVVGAIVVSFAIASTQSACRCKDRPPPPVDQAVKAD